MINSWIFHLAVHRAIHREQVVSMKSCGIVIVTREKREETNAGIVTGRGYMQEEVKAKLWEGKNTV